MARSRRRRRRLRRLVGASSVARVAVAVAEAERGRAHRCTTRWLVPQIAVGHPHIRTGVRHRKRGRWTCMPSRAADARASADASARRPSASSKRWVWSWPEEEEFELVPPSRRRHFEWPRPRRTQQAARCPWYDGWTCRFRSVEGQQRQAGGEVQRGQQPASPARL